MSAVLPASISVHTGRPSPSNTTASTILALVRAAVGPRTVWLSSAARAILDGLPRKSIWVFPSPRTDSCMTAAAVHPVWCRLRQEADLSDVRPSRLSAYVRQHGAGAGRDRADHRLLGHRNPATTLKYTHLSEAMVHEAADAVGAILEG